MNRYFLFLSLTIVILTSGCKKDPKEEELIIGKWNATSFVTDSENVVGTYDDYRTEIQLEFTSGGTFVISVTETDLSVTPNDVDTYTIASTYSWEGDKLKLNFDDGFDELTVTGDVEVTEKHLSFTATSGDVEEFITSIEAHKL